MASSTEYLDFLLDQLSGLDGVTVRPMMAEFVLYYEGKVFGGIFDDRFLVKPTASAVRLMPDAPYETPYEGAKPMLLVDDVDNRAFLETLVSEMAPELPEPKRKHKDPALD
ncbi:MAG: TfoX/Sxy family protein [Clostridia bacterium]|nr:TfoX/Sxy family protein [Clostridia bacterium]